MTDLDGTLIYRGGEIGPRTRAAITRSQAAGIPVLIATGRMFRSVRPYLTQARIEEPVVCYQGAAVARPADGVFLLHEPIELETAREAVAALEEAGHPPNVYVDDELVVSHHTAYSRAYANFQRLPVQEVGDMLAWLDQPPTKLVAVAEPDEIPALRAQLEAHFDGRLSITRSLPHLLELGHPAVSKGTGLHFVASLLGLDVARIVAFGDAENDVELLREAGFGFAVENADPVLHPVADGFCDGPLVEGVAAVIEATLDRLCA